MKQPVTLVFDVGKTNKKLFIFDEDLNEIAHDYVRFDEVPDDEGFMSEDLPSLVRWLRESTLSVMAGPDYDVKAINFSAYGASLVHLDRSGNPVVPFINYLKPFPEDLFADFFSKYGPREKFSLQTASPSMGFLNSGLQLYYLKYKKPEAFARLHRSLHFPQYLSYLFTGIGTADYTSIGCHTGLWDFTAKKYAAWLEREDLLRYLTPIEASTRAYPVVVNNKTVSVGIGVHDSSAALMPYMRATSEPFVLISTGTWSVCMNAFCSQPLTATELAADCLNFLSPTGGPVKASRLFLGQHLSNQAKLLADFFHCDYQTYKSAPPPARFVSKRKSPKTLLFDHELMKPGRFGFTNNPHTDLSVFENYHDAYYHLMDELADLQIASLQLAVGQSNIKTIFIDGGFSSNEVFVSLLAGKLPEYKIYSSSFAQGTALGAALLVNYDRMTTGFLTKNYNFKRHQPLSFQKTNNR